MTPGYSTDREFGYVPKTTTSGLRAMNTTVYQDSNTQYYPKTIQNSISPQYHQIKTNSEIQNRSKIVSGNNTGIKLISTGVSGVRREPGKYQEESSLMGGSVNMSNASKMTPSNGGTITGKASLGGRVERGYETLR